MRDDERYITRITVEENGDQVTTHYDKKTGLIFETHVLGMRTEIIEPHGDVVGFCGDYRHPHGCQDDDQWILLCPLPSWYNKNDRPRLLKANIQHGARILGPWPKDRLVGIRRWQDALVKVSDLPEGLRDRLLNPPPGDDKFFTADELRALGMFIPEIPPKGLRRWWWKIKNDAGA